MKFAKECPVKADAIGGSVIGNVSSNCDATSGGIFPNIRLKACKEKVAGILKRIRMKDMAGMCR